MEEQQAYCYFRDGKRKIDFILVYELKRNMAQKVEIDTYFANLKKQGLQIEFDKGIKFNNLVFVKLHAPQKVLLDVASIQNVVLTYEKDRTIPHYKQRFLALKNVLSREPNPKDPLFQRTSNTARGIPTSTITSSERILLVNYLLSRTDFGENIGQHGIARLIAKKTFVTAYPLHDGPWQWQPTGFLTDRQ
ncbi:hypothetical protein Trydic_g10605, partial [Trypoxylus dichotomus]